MDNHNLFRLVHYTSIAGGDEYVIIVMPGSSPDDFVEDGFEIYETLNIDGDATIFPCDRALRPE